MNQGVTPARSRPLSLGVQTTLAVNLVLFVGVASFIAVDYIRETHQRIKEKMTGLDEEAMTLGQAVVQLGQDEPGPVQALIDKVCARMSEEASPGHHILVDAVGRSMQSRAHQRESEEIVQAIRAAAASPNRVALYGTAEIVTGVHRENGVTVYVAERLENLHHEIREQIVWRSLGVVGFGLVLALAVNLVIHRLVSRPLRRLGRAIDAIGAGQRGVPTGLFGSRELDRVSQAITEMSLALAEEDARRQATLEKARRVQENLLPRRDGCLPGLCVEAIHRPAEGVAGDFYDAIILPDGSVLLCIADVSGHGVPAAMMAAILKVLLLDAAEVDPDPARVIARVNSRFSAVSLPEDFASLLVVRWDSARHTLCYANAGHEPGLLWTQKTVVRLASTGPLLGLAEGDLWEDSTVEIEPGAILVCMTDGVTESMNREGELFGRERLVAVIVETEVGRGNEILSILEEAVHRHCGDSPQTDDYTLVVLRSDHVPVEQESR